MTHLVFMKFEENFFNDEVFNTIEKAFQDLKEVLPEEIFNVSVVKNTVQRDTNMDLLIKMELKNEASLATYLKHPIHLGIGEIMNPHIINRCSFDYN